MYTYVSFILGMLGALAAQTVEPSLQRRYRDVGVKIFDDPTTTEARKGKRPPEAMSRPLSTDEIATYSSELHDLVSQTIKNVLNSAPVLDAQGVRKAVEDLQGNLSGRASEDAERGLPFASFTKLGFAGDALIVAFNVMKGPLAVPQPDPFIQLYLRTQTGWALAAEAPDDLKGRTIEVATLLAPRQDEVWVLAWGARLGDNGARLSARLYVFGANRVQTLWSRDDLRGGRINVNQKSVVLTYNDYSSGHQTPPREIRQELRVTVNGLE